MEFDPEKLDYYQRSGISEDATTKEIEAAYKTLRKQLHPDAKPAAYRAYFDHAMKGINQAHDALVDPAKRQQYDASLRAPRSKQREKHPDARPSRGDKKAHDEPWGQGGKAEPGPGQPRRYAEKKHGTMPKNATRGGRSSGNDERREQRRGGMRKGARRRGALPAASPTGSSTSRS